MRAAIAIRLKKFSVKRELQMLLVYICLVVIARFIYFPLHHIDGKIGSLKIGYTGKLTDMISLIPFFFLVMNMVKNSDRDGWYVLPMGKKRY